MIARATVPALEALQRAGIPVRRVGTNAIGAPLYDVGGEALLPVEIVVRQIVFSGEVHYGLRMCDEPRYPGEVSP